MNNLIETQYNTHFKRASLHKCGIETGWPTFKNFK